MEGSLGEQTLESAYPLDGNGGDSSSGQDVNVDNEGLGDAPQDLAAPTLDDSDDHRERSKLGRRMSKYEEALSQVNQTVGRLANMIERTQSAGVGAISQLEDRPPVDYITTPEDLEKYERWRAGKMARQRDSYANSYINTIHNLSFISPDMHTEIENEVLTNVGEYPTYSEHRDPVSDARANYLKAENKLLKAKLAGGQTVRPNVRGGVNQPTGVSGTDRMSAPIPKPIQLDEHSLKFLKACGESSDAKWVQDALKK